MKRRPYRKFTPQPELYVIINNLGEIFIGLRDGYPVYSNDWSLAKPLFKENTTILLREKGLEIIKESEL